MGNVSSHAINASVFKLPYDPVKDFAAVSVVAIAANVLVVHPSFAAKSVRELIAAAACRSRQDRLCVRRQRQPGASRG